MRIGIFADAHDHLANIRLAVERFNQEQVEVVLFAGDIVSTISVPPLKKLKCKVVACFGDNEGNKVGLRSGFSLVGSIDEAPVRYTANDGTRFVIVHMKRQLRGLTEEFDIQIVGHTHKARVEREADGRMLINPVKPVAGVLAGQRSRCWKQRRAKCGSLTCYRRRTIGRRSCPSRCRRVSAAEALATNPFGWRPTNGPPTPNCWTLTGSFSRVWRGLLSNNSRKLLDK